jgi:hypothetical protein
MSQSAEARRAARKHWSARVFRGAGSDEMERADEDFWLSIPQDQRAAVVWQLSMELFSLTEAGAVESRLPRSAFGITRR